MHAGVLAPGNQAIMESVKWTISGAMKSQTYQNSIGTTTPLSVSVTDGPWYGGVWYDSFSPYWNATPGNHTISVSVTYTNGTQGQASMTVSVAAPTVNSFTVNFGPTQWATRGGVTGFYSLMTYAASVTVVPNYIGGNIGLIQTINAADSEINQTISGGQAPHNVTTPGAVLDNNPNMTQPTDAGYIYPTSLAAVPPGGQAALPANVNDVPSVYYVWGPKTEVATLDVRMDVTFKDYLVYQAPGGLWVQLAETPNYTESGEEKWVPGTGWTQVAAPSPANATPLQGNSSLGFVAWTDYYANKYNSWTPTPT